MRTRYIPENSIEIKNEKCNAVCYLISFDTGKFGLYGYSGRKTKSDFAYSYAKLENAETKIEEYFSDIQRGLDQKAQWKAEKKARAQEFKKAVEVGSYLRTVFSYTMTLNQFYKVIEKKGNKVVIQSVQKTWTDGDIGYTGEVAPTNELVGEPFKANFSANGLTIEGQTATICSLNDSFYQNHMD